MPTADREGKARTVFVAEIDRVELACRIAEAALGLSRPPGVSAQQALDDMERQTKALDGPDVVPGFYRAARAAAEYLTECIKSGSAPS